MSEFKKVGDFLPDQTSPEPKSSSASETLPELPPESPACEYCGDMGYVSRGLVPEGGVLNQQIDQCSRCNPERPSRIPLLRLSDSFANFDLNRNPLMQDALEACRRVADGKQWCAFLIGLCGTGKTHLGIAALNEFGRGQFWKVPDLLDWIRKKAYGDGAGAEEALREFRESSILLVLDDLGTEKSTDWASEALYRILDSRYEGKLPTIITSNADFQKLDERITSRFNEGLVVCKGNDVRLETSSQTG